MRYLNLICIYKYICTTWKSIYPSLICLNQEGGGVSFSSGNIPSVSSAPKTVIDLELLGKIISESNGSLPAPVVSVSEIFNVGNGVVVIEQQATF